MSFIKSSLKKEEVNIITELIENEIKELYNQLNGDEWEEEDAIKIDKRIDFLKELLMKIVN